jgi:hypothetical protein
MDPGRNYARNEGRALKETGFSPKVHHTREAKKISPRRFITVFAKN